MLRSWRRHSVLASAILVALATPSLGQDEDTEASNSESLSLEAAAELAEQGDFGEAERVQLAERGSLSVDDRADYVHAVFELDGSQALVTSEATPDGRVELLAQVSGILVDAAYDPVKATFRLDGHGSSFGVEERVLLQAFTYRLEAEQWVTISGDAPIERRFAYRLISLLSEAPVGHRLDARIIRLSGSPPDGRDQDRSSPEAKPHGRKRGGPGTSPKVESLQCTEVLDQDGVKYHTCQVQSTNTWHDACPDHGFISVTEPVGCSTDTACLGRCGAGCGYGGGSGSYTFDCADHDSCCRIHGACFNPGDAQCGDEYNDAVDDVLEAEWNCGACAPHDPPPPPPPPPCPGTIADTTTWVVGFSSTPTRAVEQLQFSLERSERRPEAAVYMEEWALLANANGFTTLKATSSDAFGARVSSSASVFASASQNEEAILVVEAAVHPRNARFIPTPALAPIESQAEKQRIAEPREVWFRAEVAPTGQVDDVEILDLSPLLPADRVQNVLREKLRLRYADGRRHRSVVFGRGTVVGEDAVTVENALVIEPMCCEDECCLDLELDIWLCPCPY